MRCRRDSWELLETTGVEVVANERRVRAARALVWLVGAALGAAGLLTLTLQTWGSQFPFWVGIVVVAGTMLCGDLAERIWQRLDRMRPRRPGWDAA
jgi:hypothetical protein